MNSSSAIKPGLSNYCIFSEDLRMMYLVFNAVNILQKG